MTELASDDFDRADNASLGGNWSPNITGRQFLIVSNAAKPTATAQDVAESYTAVSFPNDQYSEVVLGAVEPAGGVDEGCGVICRATSPSTSFTGYRLVGNGSGFGVLRFNSGVSTSLQTGSGTTFAAGDTLRLEVRTNGANCDWSAWKNGVQFTSGTDTSPLTSGRAGIAYSSSDTAATIASWAGGDFDTPAVSGQPEKLFVVRGPIRSN
jgi:hypothetical protein